MIWRAVVGIGALGMTPDEELQMRVGIAPSRRAAEAVRIILLATLHRLITGSRPSETDCHLSAR